MDFNFYISDNGIEIILKYVYYYNWFLGDEFYDNGHTKGVIAFDGESGFWMVHSVPRYPPMVADGYGYPPTGHRYGQMYLCITLNASTVDDIGLQLRYNNPHIHDYYMPEQMKAAFKNIYQLTQGIEVRF